MIRSPIGLKRLGWSMDTGQVLCRGRSTPSAGTSKSPGERSVGLFPDTDCKAYYWSRTPETRDAARNMMSETTVQPEDLSINNAQENAYFQEYMLGGNWRGPRRGLLALARCVRYP